MNNGGSQIELIERLENTVKEFYNLLEIYAPAWYTKELRDRAEATLQIMEKSNGRGKPVARNSCRVFGANLD